MSFAKRYKLNFFIATTSTILLALVSLLSPYLIKETVDKYITEKDTQGLIHNVMLMFGVVLIETLLRFTYIYFANWVGQHIIRDIRAKIFRHILQFKMSYFDRNSVGKLVTRVVSDIETIAAFFSTGVFTIVSDVLQMFAITALMFYFNWKLAFIALSVLPILIYATRIFQQAIKATFQEVRNQVANLNGFVQERVTGMKIVQLFNRERIEYENFNAINNKHKEAYVKTIWYFSIFFPIAEILSSIGIGLIVWFGSKQIIEGFVAGPGTVMAFVQMAQMLFRPLRQIADKFNQLQMGIVSGERVFKVIDTQSSIVKNGTIHVEKLEGNINFRDVKFSYVKDEEVLKGISLDFEEGSFVSILGRSGSGKTTLLNVMSTLMDFEKGKIIIDGKDLSKMKKKKVNAIRNNYIGFIFQEFNLVNDMSVLDNVATPLILNGVSFKISRQKAMVALTQVGLEQYAKVRPPELSGGQQQRVAIARAIVNDQKIILCDEPTGALDEDNAKEVLGFIQKLNVEYNTTVILITHNQNISLLADKIVRLNSGEVVEIIINKNKLQANKIVWS